MGLSQIKVQINPDTLPSGSDLSVCNAARRSFGKRSEWDYTCECGIKQDKSQKFNTWVGCGSDERDCYTRRKHRSLKDKDKRLLEFLARGMTAGDFGSFCENISTTGRDVCVGEEAPEYYLTHLKDQLWQWRNTPTHDTPFNHCFISFEIKAPIFVCRQLVKTEYTIMSEYSRRYITEDVEFYEHTYREASKDKKQGSGDTHEHSKYWQRQAQLSNGRQLELYNAMIDSGVAPEQARGQLPLDLMTAWTWSGTLGAFAKMCRERLGSDAQKETRFVAEWVYKYLKEYYPVSAVALIEGV